MGLHPHNIPINRFRNKWRDPAENSEHRCQKPIFDIFEPGLAKFQKWEMFPTAPSTVECGHRVSGLEWGGQDGGAGSIPTIRNR